MLQTSQQMKKYKALELETKLCEMLDSKSSGRKPQKTSGLL